MENDGYWSPTVVTSFFTLVIWSLSGKTKVKKNSQYFLVYSMDNKYIAHAWANLNTGSIRKQIYLKKDKH